MNTESIDALKTVSPYIPEQRRKVLSAVQELGTATYKELSAFLGMVTPSVTARLSELRRDGLVTPTADKRLGCRALSISAAGLKVLSVS